MTRFLKHTQALGRKLLAAGMSIPEMKRAVDAYEAKLIAEDTSERAPSDLTPRQLQALELDRASKGLPPLSPSEDDDDDDAAEPSDQHRDISAQRLAAMDLERAVFGEAPVTADDLARTNLRRAADTDRVPGERAPKGFNKVRLAKINIERASRGEPELLPHEDDEAYEGL